MAHHKSALKSIKKSQESRDRNRALRSRLRGDIKTFRALLESKEELEKAQGELPKVISRVMRSDTKGVVHKKTAARRVARLSKALHRAQVAAKA